jgi:nucleoside-diphosphate-sugar epimerase
MKILVTGSEGYIGSILTSHLLKKGHNVTGLDTCFYRSSCLYHDNSDKPRTIVKDIRTITSNELEGYDAIVHMAELSNDPTGELSPSITLKINHEGSVNLAYQAKQAKVERFLYMSSCSVYGASDGDNNLSETSKTQPQTAYAVCKTLCERDIIPMASTDFSPTVFRNATVFGPSPRQRFDLVVNNLCGLAWTKGRLELSSNGEPWRPLIHVLDLANAVTCAIDAPKQAIHAQIFNVGSNSLNFRIKEIATLVSNEFNKCETTFGDSNSDNRSYKVNFNKIYLHLPNFSCKLDIQQGVQQFHKLFQQIEMTQSEFENRAFTRLKQLNYLIQTNQIDNQLFWNINH